jgi:hypothetical protein
MNPSAGQKSNPGLSSRFGREMIPVQDRNDPGSCRGKSRPEATRFIPGSFRFIKIVIPLNITSVLSAVQNKKR